MRRCLIDAGAWIALFHRDDRLHERSKAHYRQAVSEGARLVTTNYVLAESATWLRYKVDLRAALDLRRAVEELSRRPFFRIAWVDPSVERQGWEILERHADVPLSLTDAVSAAVARRTRATEIFGFDGDFRALGFDVRPVD